MSSVILIIIPYASRMFLNVFPATVDSSVPSSRSYLWSVPIDASSLVARDDERRPQGASYCELRPVCCVRCNSKQQEQREGGGSWKYLMYAQTATEAAEMLHRVPTLFFSHTHHHPESQPTTQSTPGWNLERHRRAIASLEDVSPCCHSHRGTYKIFVVKPPIAMYGLFLGIHQFSSK